METATALLLIMHLFLQKLPNVHEILIRAPWVLRCNRQRYAIFLKYSKHKNHSEMKEHDLSKQWHEIITFA